VTITLPRYAPFKTNVCELALHGAEFKEIAGNSSAILVPRQWKAADSQAFKILFTQPLPSQPATNRVALAAQVTELRETLKYLLDQRLAIEHVYDF
jgi:hypothetical protein